MDQEEYLENTNNRFEYITDGIINLGDADERMTAIIETATDVDVVPDVGKYYTFIYAPKTPRIKYDQNPLIACVSIDRWGFKGLNYHWGEFRNYTWQEVIGNLHVIYPMELNDLRSIPYQYFRINN
jgi:hypothetical protein|tara:strand:+ start:3535 stop:3912 length:378 start_codon:yes stop_codon:yes gene_type:complete